MPEESESRKFMKCCSASTCTHFKNRVAKEGLIEKLRNQDLKEVRDPASHANSLEIRISFELLLDTYKEASNCLLGWLSIRADKRNTFNPDSE